MIRVAEAVWHVHCGAMNSPISITLPSPENTARLAVEMASRLEPGDIILLDGPIGSGKTHFARSLIQASLPEPEDVPSPTFTLIQVYDTGSHEIWHADLYRLTSQDEVEELGLVEAFETAVCVVEWPEKLGDLRPAAALTVQFQTLPDAEDARQLTLTWSNPKWDEKLEFLA